MATIRRFAIIQTGVNPDPGRYAAGDVYTSLNAAAVATTGSSLTALDEQWFWEIWGPSDGGNFPSQARWTLSLTCNHANDHFLTICGAPGNELDYPNTGQAEIIPSLTAICRISNDDSFIVWQDLRIHATLGGGLFSDIATNHDHIFNRVWLEIPDTFGSINYASLRIFNSVINYRNVQGTGTYFDMQKLWNTTIIHESQIVSARGWSGTTGYNSISMNPSSGDAIFLDGVSGANIATDDGTANSAKISNGIVDITTDEFLSSDYSDLRLAPGSQLIGAGIDVSNDWPVGDLDKDINRALYAGSFPVGASKGAVAPAAPMSNLLLGRPF